MTQWDVARQDFLSFTVSQSLPKLMYIKSVMPSNHLLLCHPLLLPSVFPASGSFPLGQLFTSGGQVLELQFQYQALQGIFRLISFRIDWYDLLAVQGTLKSLLQHHNSDASICQHSAIFMVQLSYLYMIIAKPKLCLDGPLSAK